MVEPTIRRFAVILWFGLAMALANSTSGVAQGVDDRVVVNVRQGAKVNVRAAPNISANNIVGKAIGGNVAIVIETADRPPYIWYMVREESAAFEGWIRGDLISMAPETASGGANQVIDTVEVAPAQDEASVSKTAPTRRDQPVWLNDLPNYLQAVRSCVATGSAQPAVAADLKVLQRGLVEVQILDAANRQWKCVIRESGGTALRFDPMYTGAAGDRRAGPFFASASGLQPEFSTCGESEPVVSPDTGILAGQVIYTECP